ncbi:MAG: hypothetical protein PHQ85_08615 [Eubacteriales bacterium]|nr:hypothetical protein [Eubacteriales bacterium]MDD4106034.1 hypothetical protein [Eubacteriales bacterium]
MTYLHGLGALFTLALVFAAAFLSGRQVKTADDFLSAGRRAGAATVAGALTGTMVGGSATIGTAQLAYEYGFSALWFTLGGLIGLLLMAFFYVIPMRQGNADTLPQLVRARFGGGAATTLAFVNVLGSFIAIVTQVLSGGALLTALTGTGGATGEILIAALMLLYVVFGGALGAGYVGMLKMLLVGAALLFCAALALSRAGGPAALFGHPALPKQVFGNLFARGFLTDAGAGLSTVFGFMATQVTMTAIISARSDAAAKRGSAIAALIMPVMGIAGVIIGLYMRAVNPGIASRLAMPLFIINEVPGFIAGIMLSALLVTVVATGAGLGLGVSNIIAGELKPRARSESDDRRKLLLGRGSLTLTLLLSAVAALFSTGGLILDLSFLSMGLRGVGGIGVLTAALFFPERISPRAALAAILAGIAVMALSQILFPSVIDSAVPGVIISFVVLGISASRKKRAGVVTPTSGER